MTKILVLGGAGYIGSHTCKELKQNGFDPITFDNLSEGQAKFVKWGQLIEGDICNADEITAAFEKVQPAAAIHFAAFAYVGESVVDPQKYYDNNVRGALNVINAARNADNTPLIFSSSCAIYGTPPTAEINEETPKAPVNPYGRSKLMVEQILDDYSAAYGLRSVALRYFNASGDDAEGETGEAHKIETHLIPRAILAGLGRISDFSVFGEDYDTPDGSAVRDYIHVTDLARAHVAACEHLLRGGATDQFNVGIGQGYSVFEIIKTIERHIGRQIPFDIQPRRAGDPPSLISDPSKIRRQLGFEARHSDIDNIIKTAVEWHKQN